MSEKTKGTIAVVISATVFGSMPLMAKIIYREGGNPFSMTFYRVLFILPFFYFLAKKNGDISLKVTKEELKHLIILATMGYGATPLLLYSSYNYIPSGMATTIHFIYPVIVILICIIFYKEKTNPIQIISVILCLLGILMFYDPTGNINYIGLIISFVSGITYAFYTVYLDKSILRDMHTFKTAFYLSLIVSIMLFVIGIISKSLVFELSPLGWTVTLTLGTITGLGGTYLYQVGIKKIGPQSTSILSTFEPITSIIIGLLLLDESFGIKTLLGIILILAAVVLISIFEN